MSTLKHLNLTEKDFQLIIDGLDHLPNKNDAGEIMSDFFVGVFDKHSPPDKIIEKIKRDKEVRDRSRKREKDILKEDIKILQGKLLMLKRHLIEQGALNEAHNILNNIS